MRVSNILVVEDEQRMVKLLKHVLSSKDWHVLSAKDGAEALQLVNECNPDLILLDLMIPKIDGFEVCRRIRKSSQIPIVVLSGRSAIEDKVKCLNLGADDYVTKPFSGEELVARVKAAIRRNKKNEISNIKSPIICGNIRIDVEKRRVFVSDNEVRLTATEYNLFSELVINSEKILTHSYLLERIWGTDYRHDTEYLHVYIGRLRSRLESDPRTPKHIISIPGVGYLFVK